MYKEENVAALRTLDKIFENCGLPHMKIRKVNGILNAIEMQIRMTQKDAFKESRNLGFQRHILIAGSKRHRAVPAKKR